MKNLKLLVGILICCILFIHCKEDYSLDEVQSTDQDFSDINLQLRGDTEDAAQFASNLDTPEIVNDEIMKFRDSSHFFTYYDHLDQIYELDDSVFRENIVVGENFQSVYSKLLNDEFTNPSNRYQPFLADPVMQAIVNEYFEFQVGNTLVTYLNNDDVVISNINNSTARTQIRAISKGSDIDSSDIPANAFWGSDRSRHSLFGTWCGCDINISVIDCGTVRVWGFCKDAGFGYGYGDIDVCLTASSSTPDPNNPPPGTTCFNRPVYGNFEVIIDDIDAGYTLNIHAWANSDCIFDDYKKLAVNFDNYCDFTDAQTVWDWRSDGNQGLSFQTSYIHNWRNPKYVARSFSKKWNGSFWEEYPVKQKNTIESSGSLYSCDGGNTNVKTVSCSSCVELSAVHYFDKSSPFPFPIYYLIGHCDGDVIGKYRKYGTNDIIGQNQIDFDCCE